MDYVTIDLKVITNPGVMDSYRVLASTPGHTHDMVSVDFDLSLDRRKSIEPSLIALEARSVRSSTDPRNHASKLREFGQELFHCLFNREVLQLYDDQKKEAVRSHKPLRLRLTLVPPELMVLPWELLFDERSADGEYLCLTKNPEILLIRSLEIIKTYRQRSSNTSNNTAPLRILGMIADPRDRRRLQVEKERATIERALRSLRENNRIYLHWVENGKRGGLLQHQHDKEGWDVFHFIGHGKFDEDTRQGKLEFENNDGNAEPISARQFSLALPRYLQLVVLNACETARGAFTDSSSSIAHSLANIGIPVVVAMQFEISDDASVQFAETFYGLLEQGESIEEAVAHARWSIYVATKEEYRLDWAAPIIYTSSAKSISLRSTPKRQRSHHPKVPSSEGLSAVPVFVVEQEVKTRKLDPVEEVEPVAFAAAGQETKTEEPDSPSFVQPPSWLAWKGLSSRAKIGRVGGVVGLILLLCLGGIYVLPRFFLPPLTTMFCIATDFSTTLGKDNSGTPFANGAELAIRQNQNLGSGYTLEMNCADKNDNNTRGVSDPKVGFQNLQDVVNNAQVLGMVGPGSSDIVLADLLLAAQNHFPMISPNTTNPCLTQPSQCSSPVNIQNDPNPYARICANDLQQGQVDADFLARSLHLHTAYVVNDGSIYGTGLAAAFQSSYLSSGDGGNVLDPQNSQISSNTSADQFTQLARKIISLNPSAVFYGGRGSSGIVPLKTQLVQHGFTGILMTGDGVALDTRYIRDAGSATTNTYATSLEPVIAKNTPFYANYQQIYGPTAPDAEVSQAAGGYDAAMVLINAIRYVIQTNPTAFHSNIATLRLAVLQAVQSNTTGYRGLTGTISLRNGDNRAVTTLPVYTVANGQWTLYSN